MDLQIIQNCIYEIRGKKVMIDSDLAEIYQVETKQLKRAVRRNIERFPPDFMFELTEKEVEFLRCQFGTLNSQGRGQHRKLEDFMIETNMQFNDVYQILKELLEQKKLAEKPRNPIGFVINS